TFLFAVGHALEDATLSRTRSPLAELVAVPPDVAVVLREGEQVQVPAPAVAPGETVLVKNGAGVPVDGVVVGGTGARDEAASHDAADTVERVAADSDCAGAVWRGGFLQEEAPGVGARSTLARISHRGEEAKDAKARTRAVMGRFQAWHTPAIIALP